MEHKQRIANMKTSHEELMGKLAAHNVHELPPGVKREKLEAAYDKLTSGEYSLKLTKRTK